MFAADMDATGAFMSIVMILSIQQFLGLFSCSFDENMASARSSPDFSCRNSSILNPRGDVADNMRTRGERGYYFIGGKVSSEVGIPWV